MFRRPRELAVAQVEVTTRCNHTCGMCPRRGGGEDLDLEVYDRLAAFLPRVNLVLLQGWGEPLLYPRLFALLDLARQHGCRTGFTTNGSLLDRGAAREILDAGVGFVTFSLAGATPATHSAARPGSVFDRVVANVAGLVDVKRARRAPARVHLSFLLTRRSFPELPAMVSLARRLGVDRLIAANLDCPVTPADDEARVYDWAGPSPLHRALLREAGDLARRLAVEFTRPALQLGGEVLVCELDPRRGFFVTARGEVAPCVCAVIPGRYFKGCRSPAAGLTFGSLARDGMERIWWGEDYRVFRETYGKRVEAYGSLLAEVVSAAPHERLQFSRQLERTLAGNPVPTFCQSCYKAYGA